MKTMIHDCIQHKNSFNKMRTSQKHFSCYIIVLNHVRNVIDNSILYLTQCNSSKIKCIRIHSCWYHTASDSSNNDSKYLPQVMLLISTHLFFFLFKKWYIWILRQTENSIQTFLFRTYKVRQFTPTYKL